MRICSVFSEKEPLGINGTSLPSEFEIFFATIVNAEIKGASFHNLKILMFTFYITCTYFYTPKIKFKECFPLVKYYLLYIVRVKRILLQDEG